MPINKLVTTHKAAVEDIPDGSSIFLDGFGGPGGLAIGLIRALRDQGARNLTIIGNTAGFGGAAAPPNFQFEDQSILVQNNQIRKAIAAFPVHARASITTAFHQAFLDGNVELEMSPQGTLAERIRAGAFGIGAFYTPTGVGTAMAEGKEARIIDGREHLLEYGLTADYAILRAHKADYMGNLVYRGTSRNFNPMMAAAARVTIVEVDQIVDIGDLDPEKIVTPGIFVNRLVLRNWELPGPAPVQ